MVVNEACQGPNVIEHAFMTTPKCYKNPVFLHPVYEGENISAYVHYITTNTHTKATGISGFAVMFYYKMRIYYQLIINTIRSKR